MVWGCHTMIVERRKRARMRAAALAQAIAVHANNANQPNQNPIANPANPLVVYQNPV